MLARSLAVAPRPPAACASPAREAICPADEQSIKSGFACLRPIKKGRCEKFRTEQWRTDEFDFDWYEAFASYHIIYYRHATYPSEKQGLRATLVFNLHYDGLTKQKGQTYFEEAIKNVEKRISTLHPD